MLGPGSLLNKRYAITEEVGRGLLGHAYHAEDRAIGRRVFLKSFAVDDPGGAVDRVQREAAVLGRLRHDRIVELYDAFLTEQHLFLVFPLLSGQSLADRLKAGLPGLRETVGYMRDLADALAYLERERVVHRDLKPANILLDDGRVKLVDFGIAKEPTSPALTQTGQFIGTPLYMPPEVLSGGEATAAGDVYSLGVVAFELLCGRTPFRGQGSAFPALCQAILNDPLPDLAALRPGVPVALVELVTSMLSRDPGARPNAAEVRRACQDLLEGADALPEEAPQPPPTLVKPPPPPMAPPDLVSTLQGSAPAPTPTAAPTMQGPAPTVGTAPGGWGATIASGSLARTVVMAGGEITEAVPVRKGGAQHRGFFQDEIARQDELKRNREFFRTQLATDYDDLLFQARVSFWLWVGFSIVGFGILVAGLVLLFGNRPIEGGVAFASEALILFIQKIFKDRENDFRRKADRKNAHVELGNLWNLVATGLESLEPDTRNQKLSDLTDVLIRRIGENE